MGAVANLQQVQESASRLRASIVEQDIERATPLAQQIARNAASAHGLTSDPVWRAFEVVPWLGPNFTAVREVASIADEVAAEALSPVLDAAEDIDLASLGFSAGSLDLAPFAAIEAPLATATDILADADERAQRIDADATLPPLAEAVVQMREVLTEASTVIGTLHGASALLPSMLGGEGPRFYVVSMQNNAELRSSGGISGALALVRAEAGAITVVQQASTTDFPPLEEPLPVSASTRALFDDNPGRFIQNITSIPDFTEAAPLLSTRWTQRFGGQVDGVVAIDAVVAKHLIAATGPVSFGPFKASEENVLSILLSDIYAQIPDPEVQDEVFAEAATALFGAALTDGEPRALLGALAESSAENRIRIWSAHDDEQAILARSTLGGGLPVDGADGTYVGVLVNDMTGAKMDYYTQAEIVTATGSCAGEATTRVQVTWTNAAPADAADLPMYVTGGGHYGVPPGSVRTLIAVYGPEGATPSSISGDADGESAQTAMLGSRSAVQHTVLLAPGESASITVDFVGGGAGAESTLVRHTPMIDAAEPTRQELRCR